MSARESWPPQGRGDANTYQLVIVTGRGPLESPPLATETFEAPDDAAAIGEAWKRTP